MTELPTDIVDFVLSQVDGDDNDVDDSDETEFRFTNENEETIKILTSQNIAPNTARKITFVVHLWMSWVNEKNRKLRLSLSKVPEKGLETFTVAELNQWIPYFLTEIRTMKGTPYKANSILQFLLCLQTHCKIHGQDYKFLSEGRFEKIRNSLDSVMKIRQKEGRGNNPRKATIVTEEQEHFLWDNSILGDQTPKQLVTSLIFLLGIRLMLRSAEHRNLRLDMFTFDDSGFTYTEWSSKNKPGGLTNKNKKPKIIKVSKLKLNGDPSKSNRCPVVLMNKYVAAVKDKKSTQNNAFYLKPTTDGFADVPLGQHTIEKYVKSVFDSAGIVGYYTLHGVRRTGVSRLFANNVPETIIQSMSGHSSVMALREYITVPEEMQVRASESLSAYKPTSSTTGSAKYFSNKRWSTKKTEEKID